MHPKSSDGKKYGLVVLELVLEQYAPSPETPQPVETQRNFGRGGVRRFLLAYTVKHFRRLPLFCQAIFKHCSPDAAIGKT
jgi:hypothetical protein